MDITDFESKFRVSENAADGNCLFLAVAEQVDGHTHKQLRNSLCQFYETFDERTEYAEDSLYGKLKLQMIGDNTEYHKKTNKPLKKTHVERIRGNQEYAGIMDVIGLACLLRRPIELYQEQQFAEDSEYVNKMMIDVYDDVTVSDNTPIRLLFNGIDHFEALKLTTDTSPNPVELESVGRVLRPRKN